MSLVQPAQPLAPWLRPQFHALIQRRSHALLLEGPSGLGQLDLALALAHARLCEQPGPDGACGHCAGCQMLHSCTHPDFLLLAPEALLLQWEWPMDEKLLADLQGGEKRKPSKDIRVEALRMAIEFCQRTSSRERGKVVVLYPAERMNHVAANALLKTLEEPAGDILFVLASEAAHLLLPTIRSRCQSHRLAWPGTEQASEWLQAALPASQELLGAAGQRPGQALAMAHTGLTAAQWAGLPKALAQGRADAFDGFAGAELVGVLQKIAHDLWLQAVGAAPRFFQSTDLPPSPALQSLQDWTLHLQRQARVAEHPFSAGLFLQALVSSGHRALNSRP